MLLGELLVAQGLVSVSDVDRALAHQKEHGGRLGECLVALDLVAANTLGDTLRRTPLAPASVADLGLDRALLHDLLLKSIHRVTVAGTSELAAAMAIAPAVVDELLEDARRCGLIEHCGAAAPAEGDMPAFFRLTAKGSDWAAAAVARSPYVGPSPVPLARYVQQIADQSIVNERLEPARIEAGLMTFVADPEVWRMLGPAVNSGRAVLFYGPTGNGKTMVAQQLASLFADMVHIPICIEASGEIIQVFDPAVHRGFEVPVEGGTGEMMPVVAADRRWMACRRPVVAVGAELTAAALEPVYDAGRGLHHLPVHLKALNGVFLIDDLGRQRDEAGALVNRWLAPMEADRDLLRLRNGATVELPSDGLLLIAAGSAPDQVIDADLMRRIPYKIELRGPNRAAFAALLRSEAAAHLIDISEADATCVMDAIEDRYRQPLAYYQPAFLIGRLVAACAYLGITPTFNRDLADDAISHLFVAPT